MSFKGHLAFSESKQQLGNLENKIFRSLKLSAT